MTESMPLVDLNPYPANKTSGLILHFARKRRQNMFSRETHSLQSKKKLWYYTDASFPFSL